MLRSNTGFPGPPKKNWFLFQALKRTTSSVFHGTHSQGTRIFSPWLHKPRLTWKVKAPPVSLSVSLSCWANPPPDPPVPSPLGRCCGPASAQANGCTVCFCSVAGILQCVFEQWGVGEKKHYMMKPWWNCDETVKLWWKCDDTAARRPIGVQFLKFQCIIQISVGWEK